MSDRKDRGVGRRSIRRSSSVMRWRWCSTRAVWSSRSPDAIGVRDGTLRNWVAKARRERSAGAGLSGDERSELDELRAECRAAADGA